MRKQCGVCVDGHGFFAWPCCGCGQQKLLTITMAERYGVSPGSRLSQEDSQAYLEREFPRFQFHARPMPGSRFTEA